MKTATISELKQELQTEKPARLIDLCLRLARFKKENKELLTFLLFEAHNVQEYIISVKHEMDLLFDSINLSNLYFVKKTLRKILRFTNKFIRYSGSALVETELLIHFCKTVKGLGIPIHNHPVLYNIYLTQFKKIQKSITGMHEDLQYDYKTDLETIMENIE